MTQRKQGLLIGLCLGIFLLGLFLMLYPMISAWHNESVRSEVYIEHQEALETIGHSDLAEIRKAAQLFNQQLFKGEIDYLDPENNGYFQQLDIGDSGILAYVSIPKINVSLPVYHGTSDTVLKKGAGHMPQSSLPVGGESTHSVISAHTGMASDPMFSDLELLEKGDIFHIEVLGETLTYEVFNIAVVLPEELDLIRIRAGEDLATLITCTPYGVNSHRLLVQGTRIPYDVSQEATSPESMPEKNEEESVWKTKYRETILNCFLVAAGLVVLVFSLLKLRVYLEKKKKKEGEHSA